MNAISIQQVSFTYDGEQQPAIRTLSLEVPDNQVCGLVGAAGAGKSTLCYLAAGFIPQFYNGSFSGQALVDGQNVVEQKIASLVRHVGLVSANPFSQISGARFSVFEEIAFGLENLGVAHDEIIERCEWAMAALGITALRDRSPFELSGGQQQRLVIASTIALRPPVLILDEPTAQLDPPSIAELAELLRGLAHNGTTILFAEHRLEWTALLAERVVALDHGQIIADGTPQQVFTNPLLRERGIGWPLPAIIARGLREQGQLSPDARLPVTEAELVAVIERTTEPRSFPVQIASAPQQTINNRQPTTDNAQPIIKITNVQFAYPSGVRALDDVSLTIGAGERLALLGRNGAGKSTLARHLNGLLKPSAGSVLIGGVDARKATVAQHARKVGFVFQDTRNQLFARSVREEVQFGPRNLRYPAPKIELLVANALTVLGLNEVADVHPYDLPLATRRLTAVAAVLAMDTPLIVLDEPTAGLDSAAVERLLHLCHELPKQGRSVLVITHDLDFAYAALERVVVMQAGRIVLDRQWAQLAEAELTTLDAAIGLPLELRLRSLNQVRK